MTYEEAIEVLEDLPTTGKERGDEAINVAIKALRDAIYFGNCDGCVADELCCRYCVRQIRIDLYEEYRK